MFNNLKIFCITLLLTCNVMAIVNNTSTFQTVADLYIKSLSIITPQTQEKASPLKFKIHYLSKEEQQAVLFKTLATHDMPQINLNTATLDQTFLKKMQLYCGGEKPKHNILNILNNAKTVAGKAEFARMLATPLATIKQLRQRQNIVDLLLNNPELLKEIQKCLSKFEQSEGLLYKYFEPEDPVNTTLFKNVYFPDALNIFNDNVNALETWTRLKSSYSLFNLVGVPLLSSYANVKINAAAHEETNSALKTLELTVTNFTKIPSYFKSLFNTIDTAPKESLYGLSPFMAKSLITAYCSMVGGAMAWGYYQTITNEKLKYDIANHLQTKLIGVAECVRAINELCMIVSNNELLRNLPEFNDLHDIALKTNALSPELQKLLKIFNHNTFQGKASLFSITGRVLAAEQIMKKIALEFLPAIQALGKYDAYHSIAMLYKKFEHSTVKFSFVEFIENNTPYIAAENFWNPFVDPSLVVTNSLVIGDEQHPNNFIVTGPNTCGKSTLINGLLLSIYIGQTTGIAPAHHIIATAFANMNCYLNISDDIATGVSLFKAELMRAKLLIESIRNLPADKFSFTIMDEVFSGTSPKEGEAAAYRYAQELSKHSHSICGIATHYEKLTELETESFYKNYHVTVIKNDDGSLTRPFVIQEGKSTQNIAFDLLEQEGIF